LNKFIKIIEFTGVSKKPGIYAIKNKAQ